MKSPTKMKNVTSKINLKLDSNLNPKSDCNSISGSNLALKLNLVSKLNLKTLLSFWFAGLWVLLLSLGLQANQITKVNGAKVLIQLSDLEVLAQDEVYAVDDEGKKKALLRIDRVRGDRVTADVIKGKVKVGFYIESKGVSSISSGSQAVSKNRMGILLGMAQNNMSVQIRSTSYELTGMGLLLSGYFDLAFTQNIFARGKAGIKQFTAAQNSAQASFDYLNLEGSLHYRLGSIFWLGAGGAFLFTLNKSSSVPGLDISASTNSYFSGQLGADFKLASGSVIPISFDYAMYPAGAGVSASSLMLRAGYGW